MNEAEMFENVRFAARGPRRARGKHTRNAEPRVAFRCRFIREWTVNSHALTAWQPSIFVRCARRPFAYLAMQQQRERSKPKAYEQETGLMKITPADGSRWFLDWPGAPLAPRFTRDR
jgi:hypothetical protein